MMNSYENCIKEQREYINSVQFRENIRITLTDKQYANFKLMAYKAGFLNEGDLLQSFIADLIGWQSNGSDERDKAYDWYQQAHGDWNRQYYFRYFLYNFDFNWAEMREMLDNREYFNEIYEEYMENDWSMKIQSQIECLELLGKLVEADIEL